jgi:hypothetical protein
MRNGPGARMFPRAGVFFFAAAARKGRDLLKSTLSINYNLPAADRPI